MADNLQLPLGITSPADVGRLLRELEELERFLHQTEIRASGSNMQPPKSSKLFDEVVNSNQLNMLHEQDRSQLKSFLSSVKSDAPVLHMSFAADPSPLFMKKLITYLRREIHPLVLVRTGLQPNIGAGCIVRTRNKVFDLSLRQRFASKRNLLLERLQAPAQAPQQTTEARQ